MTLVEILSAYNDAALEGLASKGLLRRARRDFEAGLARVEECTDTAATVLADGQRVTIDQRGPAQASCGCPAAGVCRHILLSVMALNESSSSATSSQTVAASAVDLLTGLSEAELRKFAGADWDKALALAASGEQVSISENPPNLVVEFPQLEISVVFIAGQGLKDAAYKGPKTRARVIVAASALLARQDRGVALDPDTAVQAAKPVTISGDFIDAISRRLKRAVLATLPGHSAIAPEIFLELAVSTRVEALPRLSAELRGLAKQSGLAINREVAFEPENFLKSASRTLALLQALKVHPDDARLTGTVRREFRPADALELWMLGAARWRTGSGARGMTAHVFCPADERWYAISDGRAAGVDPGFDPETSYRTALWGIGSLDGLMGRALRLPSPAVAEDGAIARQQEGRGEILDQPLDFQRIVEAAGFRCWPVLYDHLAKRFGVGLRRRATPCPVLVVPGSFRDFRFLDLEQCFGWDLVDDTGHVLTVNLSGDDEAMAEELRSMSASIQGMLLEASLGSNGLKFRPVTIYSKGKNSASVCNLDFDRLPRGRRLAQVVGAVADSLFGPGGNRPAQASALESMLSGALDAAVAALGTPDAAALESLSDRCEMAGLTTLAGRLRALQQSPGVENALRVAFVAGETQTQLYFRNVGPA